MEMRKLYLWIRRRAITLHDLTVLVDNKFCEVPFNEVSKSSSLQVKFREYYCSFTFRYNEGVYG